MSRVGKKPVIIPSGVDAKVEGNVLTVKGPKGTLTQVTNPKVTYVIADGKITTSVKNEENVKERALWGLFSRLAANMVEGVTKGFKKQLEINGVGYKVSMAGPKVLKLDVGFSHDVDFPVPEGIEITVEKNIITVSGASKHQVGETAAQIRKIKKPEPYKGKGIKYVDETIIRKAGKAAKSASS
jgi:large subunit ribosomal protein L6